MVKQGPDCKSKSSTYYVKATKDELSRSNQSQGDFVHVTSLQSADVERQAFVGEFPRNVLKKNTPTRL